MEHGPGGVVLLGDHKLAMSELQQLVNTGNIARDDALEFIADHKEVTGLVYGARNVAYFTEKSQDWVAVPPAPGSRYVVAVRALKKA